MRSLTEAEKNDLLAVQHLIKYTLTNPNVKDFEVWKAITELERIGNTYVLSKKFPESELAGLVNLDDSKALIMKLMEILANHLKDAFIQDSKRNRY